MNIYQAKDYAELSLISANLISAQIIQKPDSVLGLATGSSPIGTYQKLVQRHKEDGLDFSRIRTVNLDEYKGLPRDNPQSYYYFMHTNLFDYVNIKESYLPNGSNPDSRKECENYEKRIRDLGGIDLQLLGIGHNGHIGFNEPDSIFASHTHCVNLQERTIEANKRFFDSIDEVPKQAYTMGIRNIMAAKKILLVATGTSKAEALYNSLYGPITPKVPASILQLHPDLTVVADDDALSMIREKIK